MTITLLPTAALADGAATPSVSGTNICANGAPIKIVAGTMTDYTNILYDKDRDGVIGDTEYLDITAPATAAGYNLSGYNIFGGAQSGTITGDSMITVDGGKVSSVYGGNFSNADMSGGTTIVMNGGSVARLLACGWNDAVGSAENRISISIHGGTVRGGADQSVNLESRNTAGTTLLLIDGGLINGRISVKSAGAFVIKGGTVAASIISGTPTPTNGAETPANVYKTTLTVKDNNGSPINNASVSALTADAGYAYGMGDVKTDANGKLYVYLPAGTKVTAATVGDERYESSVGITVSPDGSASGDLMKTIQPSLLSPCYDTESQTLTVNYDPGAPVKAALLYAAAYESEKLLDVAMAPATSSGGTVEFTIDPAYQYKIFALDPVTYAPLCAAAEYTNDSLYLKYNGTQTLPTLADSIAATTSCAVNDYVRACLLTYELEQLYYADDVDDPDTTAFDAISGNSVKLAEAQQTLNEAIAAWDQVLDSGAVLSAVSAAEIERLEQEAAQTRQLMRLSPLSAGGEDPVEWAQKLTEQFDALEGSNRIKTLAQNMGCDAKRAYAQLTMAQNILQGQYAADVGRAEEWIAVLEGTKTASKVGVFLCGAAIAAGPTALSEAGYLSLGEAAGLSVSGVDCLLTLEADAAQIFFGADSQKTLVFKERAQTASNVAFAFGLVTGGGGEAGEKLAFLGDLGERAYQLYNDSFTLNTKEDGTVEAQTQTVDVSGGMTAAAAKDLALDKGFEPESKTPIDDISLTGSTDAVLEALLAATGLTDAETTFADIRAAFDDLLWRDDSQVYTGDTVVTDAEYVGFDDGEGTQSKRYQRELEEGSGHFTAVGLYQLFSDGILRSETMYSSTGAILWNKSYDESGLLTVIETYHYNTTPASCVTVRYYRYPDSVEWYLETQEDVESYSGWVEHGVWARYASNGFLRARESYQNGKKCGQCDYYTDSGYHESQYVYAEDGSYSYRSYYTDPNDTATCGHVNWEGRCTAAGTNIELYRWALVEISGVPTWYQYDMLTP